MTNYSDAKYGMIPSSGGITQVDMWGLLNDVTTSTSQTTITSGFTRFGLPEISGIGTGMTESSGVFSFPQTGLYQIKFHAVMKSNSADQRYIALKIMSDADGDGSFTAASQSFSSIPNLGFTFGTVQATTLIDVTNTTNQTVSFIAYSANSAILDSASTYPSTFFQFIRLGS